jgi:hypothetical protein
MILPDERSKIEQRVKYLVDCCLETRTDRNNLYNKRERYFLFGTAGMERAKANRILSHLDLVSSFLYSPDHAFYHISAARNADEEAIRQATALQDEFNDDFNDDGLNDAFSNAIVWQLVYDTMIYKQGWNDRSDSNFAELVAPSNFGVFDERITDLSSQPCFVHTYPLEWYDSVTRIARAGRSSDIPRVGHTNQTDLTPFPDMLQRLIIAATSGSNLSGNIIGGVNPDYMVESVYQPKTQHPMVWWNELVVFDDEANDWRYFHMCEPDILISDSKDTISAMMKVPALAKKLAGRARKAKEPDDDDVTISETNFFLPGEHPYTKIQTYPKYNYFWGHAHIDALIPLQDWLNERLEQVSDILEEQAYPPKSFTGMSGLPDEKAEAFGGADTWVMDPMPGAKVDMMRPEMPPDIFAETKEIDRMFLEQSGLTEVISGKGESGVRSRQHAKELRTTGSGRIKRAALCLEPSLVRVGDIGLKLKMRNDDEEIIPEPDEKGNAHPFYAAGVSGSVKIRISGHAHSPLFRDDSHEDANLLIKAKSIDEEMYARMLNPPNLNSVIHALRKRKKQQAAMIKAHPELVSHPGGRSHKGA